MSNPKIQLRHDTPSNWSTVNPVLLDGEVGIQKDITQYNINMSGNLVNSNGILTNFSTTNYATLSSNIVFTAPFEVKMTITTGTDVFAESTILCSNRDASGLRLGFTNQKFIMLLGTANQTWQNGNSTSEWQGGTVLANTKYFVKCNCVTDGNQYQYTLSYSLDDESYTIALTFTSSQLIDSTTPTYYIGRYASQVYTFHGTVDLNDCYILTNNTKIWEGTTLGSTKLKIGDGTAAWNSLPYFMSDAVKSSSITNIVQISQADYDALTTKDANTLYVIV